MRHPFALVAALWSTALSLVLTWPMPAWIGQAVLGSPRADGMKHVWTLWWMRREVASEGHLPFATDYVNFPRGMDLYPIEPLNGLAATALSFLSIEATTNLIALGNLTLTGLATALLGRELGASRWGALACGTLLQGSALALFTIHVGVGELQHLWWLPIGFLAWLRHRRQPGLLRAAWLGLVLAAACLSCFYHGFFLAIGVSVLSLTTLWAGRKTPMLLVGYALAAAGAVLIVVPAMNTFSTSYAGDTPPELGLQTYVFDGEHGQPVTDPPSARLDPSHLLGSRRADRDSAEPEVLAYGGGRYLGWLAVLLGCGAIVLKPRAALPWLGVAAAGILVALGSYLVRGGEEALTDWGARYELPFLYLNRALGYVAEPLNFPVRALALTSTALAVMAAVVSTASVRGRPLGPLVFGAALLNVVDVQANQLIPRPMPAFSLPDLTGLDTLADASGALLDVSLAWRSDQETRGLSLAAQLRHQQRIQGVPLERIEYFAQDGQLWARALPFVQLLELATYEDAAFDADLLRADLALIDDAGFDHVMVLGTGGDRQVPPRVEALLDAHLGEPVVDDLAVKVWAVPPTDASADELATWRTQHEARVAALEGKGEHEMNPMLK